jgi:CspA family cold shock protein
LLIWLEDWKGFLSLVSLLISYFRIINFNDEDIMTKGTVKWFNAKKGYGFIQPDEGEKDIFVHITAVKAAGIFLNEGTRLEFEVVANNGKQSAENLKQI